MLAKPRKRRGVVAVLVAVALVAVLGIVALGLDGGLLLDNRIRVQAAADASALAAASDLFKNWTANAGVDKTGTARTSALANAAANGFANDTINSVVTVTFNPGVYQSGPSAGTTIPVGYVEVIIRQNQKRGFSSFFGSSDLPVVARAVARGMRRASSVGVLLMDASMSNALRISGTASMKVDGTVAINSSSGSAASGSGSAQLISKRTDIVGSYSGSGSYFQSTDYPGGLPKTGVQPVPDFIQDVPWPDPNTFNDQGNAGKMTIRRSAALKVSSGQTLQPGVYTGGIDISTSSQVTFAPGIFYLRGGGMKLSSNSANIVANGVMFVNAPSSTGSVGAFSLVGGSSIVISPITTGRYFGISIFQDRASTQTVTLTGGTGWNLTGTVYARSAFADVTGGANATMGSQFIVDSLRLTGNTTFNNINPGLGFRPRDIRLVE